MECLRKLCEVCDENDRVYKCPRCGMGTCSLKCCVQHKQTTGCDGKRDKTAYIPVKNFNESHLKSDYHFLEDVLQTRQSAKRTFEVDCGGEQRGNNNPHNKKQRIDTQTRTVLPIQPLKNYSNSAKTLVKQAKDRGTTVLLQPQGMSKRQANTSRYDKKGKRLIWQLTVVFVLNANFNFSELLSYDGGLQRTDKPRLDSVGLYVKDVSEFLVVEDLINQVVSNLPIGSQLAHFLRSFKLEPQLNVLIRKLPSPANEPLFSKINVKDSLRDGLSGHQVVEFPTLIVCKDLVLPLFRLMINEPANVVSPSEDSKVPSLITSSESQAEKVQPVEENNYLEFSEDPNVPLEISLNLCANDAEKDQSSTDKDADIVGKDEVDDNLEQEEEDINNDEAVVNHTIDNEEGDEGYEEFMKNLVSFQGKDIRTLQSIIRSEENTSN